MTLDEMNKKSKGTLVEHLGIVFTAIDDGNVEATMPIDERTCQSVGILHGGATLALAETLGGVGSFHLCGGQNAVGIEVSGHHFAMAKKGQTVRAEAKIIHQGRTTHVWNVDAFIMETGQLIASVRVTNFIIHEENCSQK